MPYNQLPDILHILMLNIEDGIEQDQALLDYLHAIVDVDRYRASVTKMHIKFRKERGRIVTQEQADRLFDKLYDL
jgi:hypothetical protein